MTSARENIRAVCPGTQRRGVRPEVNHKIHSGREPKRENRNKAGEAASAAYNDVKRR